MFMLRKYRVIKFVLILFAVLSSPVNASDFVFSENHSSYQIPSLILGDTSDKLLIPAPHKHGFSQVSLDTFSLNKPLQLINAASLNPSVAKKSEATTIVLELSSDVAGVKGVNLTSEIELIGKAADLIILSRGSNISCTGCSFKGFSRITISTGLYYSPASLGDPMVIDESNLSLYLDMAYENMTNGDPNSVFTLLTQSGSINIQDLHAEGVVFLDLIAENVYLRGALRTNLKGTSTSDGEFSISPYGDKEISSGSIQVHGGKTYFNYFNSSIYKKDTSVYSQINSSAKVEAGSFAAHNHSANGGIYLGTGSISTLGDYSLLNIYQGNNIVSDGEVKFNTLGDVEIYASRIKVETELAISANALKIGDDSVIGSEGIGKINLSLASVFWNYGSLVGNSLLLSAQDVENEGVLSFDDNLYINSAENVINAFGGVIHGSQVLVEASRSVINGFYYPFRLNLPKYPLMYRAMSQPEVKPHETGFFYNSLDGRFPKVTTYPASSLAATILGENVELKAPNIININPYYLLNNTYLADTEGALDPILSDQVVISANNNLTIRSQDVVNVSSIIESVGGELAIIANSIANERYRMRVDTYPGNALPDNFCDQFNGCITQSNTENVVADNLVQYAQYYSPAGRLYSGERALFVANTRMLNALSYVEIYGDLDMKVNDFLQLGYAYNNVVNIDIITRYKKRVCKAKVFGKCIKRKTVRWQTEEPHQENFVIGQIPTLFSVAGFVSGIGEGDLVSYTEDYINTYSPSESGVNTGRGYIIRGD